MLESGLYTAGVGAHGPCLSVLGHRRSREPLRLVFSAGERSITRLSITSRRTLINQPGSGESADINEAGQTTGWIVYADIKQLHNHIQRNFIPGLFPLLRSFKIAASDYDTAATWFCL